MPRKVTILFFLVQLWTLKAQLNDKYPGIFQITEPLDLSESPVWDSRNNILYFVNIYEGQVFRYNPETSDLKSITLQGTVAPALPSKSDPNLLIVGLNRSLVAVEWDGESEPSEPQLLSIVSEEFPASRFNDGKPDKQGRLWLGTMGREYVNGVQKPDQAFLYKFSCDNLTAPEVEIAPVTTSNGLAWNAANDKFFYIDTPTGQVVQYDYDDEAGEITNRKVVFDVNDYPDKLTGNPDGMTIDEDDNLWVALFGGGAIVKVDSKTGELLQIVPIPARDVTSAMWGGPDLDVLYVTSARLHLTDDQKKQQASAGAVFAVTNLGTKGLPAFEVDILSSENKMCS